MARKLYEVVGEPTLQSLKIRISQSIIHNFPVTVEYIDIEEKIFSPDVYTLKGRTTRQSPNVVVGSFIEIPR